MANKVKFGLSNVYYSVWTESTDSYADPVKIDGAVNLSLSQEGGTNTFRADNVDYWTSVANNGYSGTLEVALIPDSFLKDVMGEGLDAASTSTGVQYEIANAQPKPFALLFQFEGDENATRYVMYNCKATRPNVEGETTGETIDPKTESLSIVCKARATDSLVKAKAQKDSSKYATWFEAVYIPTIGA